MSRPAFVSIRIPPGAMSARKQREIAKILGDLADNRKLNAKGLRVAGIQITYGTADK